MEASSFEPDRLDSLSDSGFHHMQVKSRISLIPSQSVKTQAFSLVVNTNIALLELSLQGDSARGQEVSDSGNVPRRTGYYYHIIKKNTTFPHKMSKGCTWQRRDKITLKSNQ